MDRRAGRGVCDQRGQDKTSRPKERAMMHDMTIMMDGMGWMMGPRPLRL